MRLSIPAFGSNKLGAKPRAVVSRSVWSLALERFAYNRLALAGLALLAVLILLSVFAGVLAPYNPIKRNVAESMVGPSPRHWLGTDPLGRDQFSRVLYGGRLSLYVGLASVVLSMAIGVPVGLASGYFGGIVDGTLMRMVDLILAFPGIIFAIWLVAMLGPGINQVILANALFNMPSFARIIRGNVLTMKEADYVHAARSLGANDLHILATHILPNVVAPIVVLASLTVSDAVLTAASLSFLGLGSQPPTPEWGAMLSDGRPFLRNAWWLSLFPGLMLTLTVLGSNIVGDGLRDALDPRKILKRIPG
jgi:peptide/nickel transport system permease protein